MDRWTREELMAADREADMAQVSAAELGEEMAAQAQEERADEALGEQEALEAQVREGIGELFEDGWTAQELTAFSQDALAREAIAQGKSVARAACAYLRARFAGGRKRGVPTARTIAAGGFAQESPIDAMTDEEFDAFSRRAQAAMMAGKRVRI